MMNLSGTIPFLFCLAMALLIGCRDDPVSSGKCSDVTVLCGVEDNFDPGNQENTLQGPELLEFMNYYYRELPANPLNQLTERFDEGYSNRAFGHTIRLENLPAGAVISAATLTVRMKALSGEVGNDNLNIADVSESGRMESVWGSALSDFNNGRWVFGDEVTVILDLADLSPNGSPQTNVLKNLENGDLSIYVQDDTSVDYIKLNLTYCIPDMHD